jgi:hypothetical protein
MKRLLRHMKFCRKEKEIENVKRKLMQLIILLKLLNVARKEDVIEEQLNKYKGGTIIVKS